MIDLPLSKTLDPADFDQLTEELAIVDRHFTKDREQHPMRRWEYAMALRAISTWWATKRLNVPHAIDVGGAGSPFWRMIDVDNVYVVDPDATTDLAHYVAGCPRLSPIVTCLSVIEHVDDLDRFLYHLGCLVAPGGLLFLTMDACNHERHALNVEDPHHFSWMRKRIFYTGQRVDSSALHYNSPEDWLGVLRTFNNRDFTCLGGPEGLDQTYHGPQVYDYTFASLALIKRP